ATGGGGRAVGGCRRHQVTRSTADAKVRGRLVARAREPKPNFQWVLVWKLSRFGRDIEEGLIYRAVLRKKDIELISFKEPIPEGPLGQLITHVLMAVDQFYAAATAAA